MTLGVSMGRMHLFELEDQPWFPRLIRAYMQDHLRFMGDWSGPAYQGFVEKLKAASSECLDDLPGRSWSLQHSCSSYGITLKKHREINHS